MKKNLVFPKFGEKGSNRAPKRLFQHYLKKASFVFPDFLHVIRGHQCASFSENRTSSKNLVPELGPKRGSNRAPKGPFRHYLKKSVSDFPDFLHVNRGYQCASFGENRMSRKNLVPELWVKRGANRGQIGPRKDPFDTISKSVVQIFSILCMRIEVDSGFLMPQTGPIHRFWFWTYGPKRVQNLPDFGPRKGSFSIISKN